MPGLYVKLIRAWRRRGASERARRFPWRCPCQEIRRNLSSAVSSAGVNYTLSLRNAAHSSLSDTYVQYQCFYNVENFLFLRAANNTASRGCLEKVKREEHD